MVAQVLSIGFNKAIVFGSFDSTKDWVEKTVKDKHKFEVGFASTLDTVLSNIGVDLRESIPDFSNNPIDYLPVLKKIVEILEKNNVALFGCAMGCGRTFTVLALLLGYYSRDPRDALKKFAIAEAQRGEGCPEAQTQKLLAALALISPNRPGKPLNEYLADLSKLLTLYVLGDQRAKVIVEKGLKLLSIAMNNPKALLYALDKAKTLNDIEKFVKEYDKKYSIYNNAKETYSKYRKMFDDARKEVQKQIIVGLRTTEDLKRIKDREERVLAGLKKVIASLHKYISAPDDVITLEVKFARDLLVRNIEKLVEKEKSATASYSYGLNYSRGRYI